MEDVDELMNKGFDALSRGAWEEAETLGRILREERRHTSGFEIEAMAKWELNERDEAIALLREGTGVAPSVTRLWHWLGSYLSDTGEYDAAIEAFERSSTCPGADVGLELFNLAIVHNRKGDAAAALEVIDREMAQAAELPPAEYWFDLRTSALLKLKRWDEAEEAADAGLSILEQTEEPGEAEHELCGRLFFHKAEANWAGGTGDVAAAREYAVQSWRMYPRRPEPLALVREIDGLRSERAKEWRLNVFCEPSDASRAEGTAGYFLPAWAIADTAEEAMSFLAALEPEQLGTPVSIEEQESIRDAPGELKGLLGAGGRHAFGPEDADED